VSNFTSTLNAQVLAHGPLCLGIDPSETELHNWDLPDSASGAREFALRCIEAAEGRLGIIKPQVAFFERFGSSGFLALEEVLQAARDLGLVVIGDAKRGDIGSTAQQYAREAFERYGAHAVTLSPFMGRDSVEPYLEYTDKGVFLLCRTSNPGGSDLQNQRLADVPGQPKLFEHLAHLAQTEWNTNGQVGLVVGATFPAEIARVRELAPTVPLLIPGVGAQGGDADATVKAGATANGMAVINSSRAILYASSGADFAQAARAAALATRDLLNAASSARAV